MKRITRHTHKPIERPSVGFPTPLPDYSAAADKLTDGHSLFQLRAHPRKWGSAAPQNLLHFYCILTALKQ